MNRAKYQTSIYIDVCMCVFVCCLTLKCKYLLKCDSILIVNCLSNKMVLLKLLLVSLVLTRWGRVSRDFCMCYNNSFKINMFINLDSKYLAFIRSGTFAYVHIYNCLKTLSLNPSIKRSTIQPTPTLIHRIELENMLLSLLAYYVFRPNQFDYFLWNWLYSGCMCVCQFRYATRRQMTNWLLQLFYINWD